MNKIGRYDLKPLALGVFLAMSALFAAPLSAQAQNTAQPAVSAAAVRAALTTGDAPGSAAKPTAATGATVSPAAATATPAAEASSPAASANGIELPGMDSIPQVSAEQLELERQAEEAAARAATDQQKRDLEHNRKSYKKAQQGLLPLSTEQVRTFMERLETTQEAAVPPHEGQPRGEVKVQALSLDPGGEPPQVNLAAGFVTTIDIVDQTGEPWPILDVGVGGNFEVTPTQAGSHVVRVVPLTRYGTGNLSIMLKDLSTPVIFRLAAGGPTFHMRFDARVPKLGPHAKTPIIQRRRQVTGLVAGDETISMLLENAPPKNAKRLKVGGTDARTMAWQIGDKTYVRTPLALLSPAWNASASSADGMSVYEVGDAPVLLLSDGGAMIRAHLLRDDNHDR